MKTLLTSNHIQFLVLIIVSGTLSGCGSWFAKKQEDSSEKTNTATVNLVPLDSLLINKECYTMDPLRRLPFKGDTLSFCIYHFDTSANKCRLRPDFTFETAFTKPEFKQFFNIPPDFTVEHWIAIQGDHHYWMYYKGIRIDCHSPVGIDKNSTGCSIGARVNYFYPKGEPENIQVSPEVAIDSATKYYIKCYKRVPRVEVPATKLAYYIRPGTNSYIYLCHKINLGDQYIYIDAITGTIRGSGSANNDVFITTPCNPVDDEPDYPVTLWYGNDLPYFTQYPDEKQIWLSSCDFGSCKLYHLKQDNTSHRMESYTNPDDFTATSDSKRYHWWSDDGADAPPGISLNFSALPSAWGIADGQAVIAFTPPSGIVNDYTMGGTFSGTNNTLLTGLSAGIHTVNIVHNTIGCNYPQAIAIGTQDGFIVTPTLVPVTCYQYGNIVINMSNAAGAEVMITGPIATPQFNGIVYSSFPAGSNSFDVAEQLNAGSLLPPGNYAILVQKDGKYTALNLRLDYPNCPNEISMLSTAYWAIERVHSFFQNPASLNCYFTSAPPAAPTTVNLSLTSGINQFTAGNPLIELCLLNSWELNAATNLTSLVFDNKIRIRVSNGNGSAPMVDLDILAHEYAHAINAKGVNVQCDNQPVEGGALVESFCDIMGIMVQSTIRQLDWNIGESVGTLRALNTPKLYNNPTTYGGQYWNAATTSSDGMRYTNSGVFSYWFYLLASGQSGTVDDGFSAPYPNNISGRNVPSATAFNVPAIGAEKAAKILLEVFTTNTISNSWGLNNTINQNYLGIAKATLTVAGQLYGTCSAEVLAVREAWRAVGIDAWQAESVTCDITKPYIKELKVTNSSGAIKYHKHWQINPVNGKLCLTDVTATSQSLIVQTGNTFQLEVTSSEPLSDFSFLGFKPSGAGLLSTGFTSAVTSSNATIWTATITTDASLELPGGEVAFVFSGHDMAGNELLSMHNMITGTPPCLNYNDLPQRFSPTAPWMPTTAPQGTDEIHKMNLYACSLDLPDSDICDNHLPYIQSVQINDIATGYIIAHQSWELTESQTHLCLVNNIEPEQTTDLTQGLFLTVVTSEPMSNLAFAGAVAPTGIIYYSGINQVSGSGTNWFFTLSSFNLAGFDSNTDYKLRFSGQDLAGNDLISMHEYEGANSTPPCIATNALPYKDSNENWMNYISGFDKSFGFTYRCNLSAELLIVCNYTSTTSSVYFNINITSCAEDEVTWFAQMDWDGDGNFDQSTIGDAMGTTIVYNSTSNGQAQLTLTNTVTGEQLVLNAYCNDIPVSDDCENVSPDFDDTTFSQNPHYCLGESVCISYYVTDFSPIENVTCSAADATHAYQSGYHHNPAAPNYDDAYYWQSGTFCFTPTATDAAQGDMFVFLSATDMTAVWCQQTGHAACIVTNLCCPTGFDYPQELEAVYDCNGDLYQPAEATVMALTNGCNLDFTVNGSSNHTLSHLGEGVYDLTLSFNNQTYLIEDAISVEGIYLEDGNLQITHTAQPSLGACSSDQCNGQITLSVAGGSGNYTYHWSDCIPPPGEMMLPCNSPLRNQLCTGSYTVTVADDLTGCQTVYTAGVSLYYPPNAGVLSDNEFSVSPTIFSGSTTLTYRVGYDAQVSISMFSSQGILVDAPLQQEFRAEGQYNMTHSPPSGLPQGVYYYVLYVCEQYITRVAIKID